MSVACGGRTCMVYELEGDPSPECSNKCAPPDETRERVFCTCRCDGPEACACPTGFACEPVVQVGPRESYCVRESL
ncbi:MAG: hypothetical protein AAGF12_43195 [Myxococcota bacterium]